MPIFGTRKKYYEPPDDTKHLRGCWHMINLGHTYNSTDPYGTRLLYLYYSTKVSKSISTELRRYDMAGIIVKYLYPPEGEKPKVYLVEDEFDSSVIGDPFEMTYWAVYPESYKGLVPYYVGCDILESGKFDRPLRDKSPGTNGGLDGSWGVSSQVYYDYWRSGPRRRNAYTRVLFD
ncbi:hypothetical protein TWF481_008406 [Arthrobotrys musiformis]|uniref:Uncharacterized protein n=1 Tax=Arthrobotrys musiformis TaxID=47236 RepID=A0AAV9W800_9PEZI